MPRDLAAMRADSPNVTALPIKLDRSILTAGRRSPPVMPRELFGPTWGMIEDFAGDAGSPVDYVGLSFLVACASLIGGKRWGKVYEVGNWREPCILWAAVVGDPSSNKSPGLASVTTWMLACGLTQVMPFTVTSAVTALERSYIAGEWWAKAAPAAPATIRAEAAAAAVLVITLIGSS